MISMKRLPDVKNVLGHRADASVYNAIRAGLFTPGISIGTRAKAWPDYEVDAINLARIAGFSEDRIKKLVCDLTHARVVVLGMSDTELRGLVNGMLADAEVPA